MNDRTEFVKCCNFWSHECDGLVINFTSWKRPVWREKLRAKGRMLLKDAVCVRLSIDLFITQTFAFYFENSHGWRQLDIWLWLSKLEKDAWQYVEAVTWSSIENKNQVFLFLQFSHLSECSQLSSVIFHHNLKLKNVLLIYHLKWHLLCAYTRITFYLSLNTFYLPLHFFIF